MSGNVIQSAFSAGELSPGLLGRVDLQKYHLGCSTLRNFFADYRGGALSRAGTAFVGPSKTRGTSEYPPRLIEFAFNLDQGYVLEFGDEYMRPIYRGAYITETASNITAITMADPAVVSASNDYSNGDQVYITDTNGMVQVNGRFFQVSATTTTSFALYDFDGLPVSSLPWGVYTNGGTVAKLVTVTSPYAIEDLAALKFTQSADVMSFAHPDYPPYELTRNSATSWSFATASFSASVAAPTSATATASSTTASLSTSYQYVVTALTEGANESVASNIASVTNSVDISNVAGTITVNWTGVTGASQYNVYRSPAAYNTTIPAGVVFGYVGSATSSSFIDTNIVPDYTFAPPQHFNPFSSSSNYPSVVTYFQQRRVYANTLNQPDTYFMSRPGAFTDFDAAIPTRDEDSIIGNPWAQQVNGIQAMVPMPGGLVILTGLGAWQLSGAGQQGSPVTPASQTATPQAFNGCHNTIPPIVVNYDILYVQAKGSIVRDLAYNFFVNIYTGTDMSQLSNHLFQDYHLVEWDWCEEPFKLLWAVRDDGTMLSLTFLKEQDVQGWARHDTNGLFVSVASVTEPPVDALYMIVKRWIDGQWEFYVERMNDRIWPTLEHCWCVDCGLSYPMPEPDATLVAAAVDGAAGIGSATLINGGSGYTAPTFFAQDDFGTGATFTASLSAGVITAITVTAPGQDYELPTLVITDATGTGASASLVVTNPVTFTATPGVFTLGDVGSVIRMGNGAAEVTDVASSTSVTANVLVPITAIVPNTPADEEPMPMPALSGEWTLTAPTQTVRGLNHLEGKYVTGLADGSVFDPVPVIDGAITLPASASAITAGLAYLPQLQTMYLDVPGGPTIQGRRKMVNSAYIRVQDSRGFTVGTNQPDASNQPGQSNVPWGVKPALAMTEPKEAGRNANVYAGRAIPLFTGDVFVNVESKWSRKGQVAVEQPYPLPANILDVVSVVTLGDDPG